MQNIKEIKNYLETHYPIESKEVPEFLEYWGSVIKDIIDNYPGTTLRHAYLDIGRLHRKQTHNTSELDNNIAILIFNIKDDTNAKEYLKSAMQRHRHEGIDAYNYIISCDTLIVTCDGAY